MALTLHSLLRPRAVTTTFVIATMLALATTAACSLADLGPLPDASGGGGGNTSTSSGGGTGGTSPARGWPDSKTAFCSDGMAAIACDPSASPPQDGTSTKLAAPSYTYVDINEQVLRDDVTGLAWTTSPVELSVPWASAAPACKALDDSGGLGGLNGWRLPSRLELASLFDLGQSVWRLPGEIHVHSELYWSSTPFASMQTSPKEVWTAYFGDAATLAGSDESLHGAVLCVNGTVLSQSLVIDTDTITDPLTRLMWQRNPSSSESPGKGWAGALAYCLSIDAADFAGHHGWRLATSKELLTIVDPAKSKPPASFDGFHWNGDGQYWSSTPFPDDPSKVYRVDASGLQFGGLTTDTGTYLDARCVRSLTAHE